MAILRVTGLITVMTGGAWGQASFPDVPLVADSVPLFTTLALDETGEHAAYILFDGNADNQYQRAYVWIPNHARYGRPVTLSRGEGEFFPPLTIPVPDAPNVETTWQLRAWNERHGGHGEHVRTRHDYLTGETISETISAREERFIPRFDFRVRYRHAGRYARSLQNASDALDVLIEGRLSTGNSWDDRPDPDTPWHDLYLRFSVDEERLEEERHTGRLVFQLHVGHHRHHFGRARFTHIPDNARVQLDVSPYMEEPAFSEALPPARLLAGGFPVTLPYGWYEFKAALSVEGLTATPHTRSVFPFARR